MRNRNVLVIVVAIVSAACLAGCAAKGGFLGRGKAKGPSNEQLIGQLTDTMKTALLAKDVEKVMTLFSNEFSTTEMPDKESAQALIEYGISMGFFDYCDVTYDMEDLTIDNDQAQLYPFQLQSGSDLVIVDVKMSKEKDGWKITGMSVEGI